MSVMKAAVLLAFVNSMCWAADCNIAGSCIEDVASFIQMKQTLTQAGNNGDGQDPESEREWRSGFQDSQEQEMHSAHDKDLVWTAADAKAAAEVKAAAKVKAAAETRADAEEAAGEAAGEDAVKAAERASGEAADSTSTSTDAKAAAEDRREIAEHLRADAWTWKQAADAEADGHRKIAEHVRAHEERHASTSTDAKTAAEDRREIAEHLRADAWTWKQAADAEADGHRKIAEHLRAHEERHASTSTDAKTAAEEHLRADAWTWKQAADAEADGHADEERHEGQGHEDWEKAHEEWEAEKRHKEEIAEHVKAKEAEEAEEQRIAFEKYKCNEMEAYCQHQFNSLTQYLVGDPWETICLSGDTRYDACQKHSPNCASFKSQHSPNNCASFKGPQ